MSTIGFIPARLGSSRFNRKVLHDIEGKSMIRRVYEGSCTNKLDEIHVTTCDQEIADHVKDFGASVIMTSNKHERCLDRVAEAYEKLVSKSKDDVIICIQGDEPLIHKEFVDYFIKKHIDNCYEFSVAAVNINNLKEFEDPDIVKIIWNELNKMVYTSRSPIPYLKEFKREKAWKIFGMFGFKPEGLRKFNFLKPTFLEKIEQCDTNRICGSEDLKQYVIPYSTNRIYQAIDNRSNLDKVVEILKNEL